MFPMGRRGRDIAYTRQVMSDRLKWLHPQIKQDIRWDYFWFGELDMQYRTVPRLYGLAPGVVALTGLSGRGVPTGSMLGGILSEWALDVPEKDLSLKIEPLHKAPFYMSYGPQLTLRITGRWIGYAPTWTVQPCRHTPNHVRQRHVEASCKFGLL